MSASRMRSRAHRFGNETHHHHHPSQHRTAPSGNEDHGTYQGNNYNPNHRDEERAPLISHVRSHLGMGGDGGNRDGKRSGWLNVPIKVARTFWQVILSQYTNVLLVFVPLGMISGALGWPAIAVFVLNFMGIIPLAGLLSFATEELAAVLGPSIGGLLNATFGNAIELIVSIVALVKGEIRIVQASMLGSILANILLVLGMCFVAGGVRRLQSKYDSTLSSVMASLQAMACAALIVPAILYASLQHSKDDTTVNIMILSRGTSIILFIVYFVYLYFQLGSHASLFQGDDPNESPDEEEDEGVKEGDTLSPAGAILALCIITACVAVLAEFLVDSIDEIVESTGMSKTFIGIIILPIVSNAAEHITAVIVSWKGKMNLAICVDLGSSLQIALFVTPLLVIIGWILGQPMSLHFHGFEVLIFFLSVIVVNGLIRDGQSNYLEGTMLLGWYIITAVAFYVYPDDQDGTGWVFRL